MFLFLKNLTLLESVEILAKINFLLSNVEIIQYIVKETLIFLLKINTKNFNLYLRVLILCFKKCAQH